MGRVDDWRVEVEEVGERPARRPVTSDLTTSPFLVVVSHDFSPRRRGERGTRGSCPARLVRMRIARRLFVAAPALLMGLLLLVAGPVAAQDAAVEGVAPAADEIAANARAKEAAVLAAELGQLRAKISALGACSLTGFRLRFVLFCCVVGGV